MADQLTTESDLFDDVLHTASMASPATDPSGVTLYFPLIQIPDSFPQTPAIWSHDGTSAAQETVLFRHHFTTDESLTASQLRIFADTRYEIWLDGEWVGRGPARFSEDTREYDRYDLGRLTSGRHLIAVLVQWAPNGRRSESETPFLQATIHATTAQDQQRLVTQTGNSEWHTLASTAWQPQAALVHMWNLIGPTELLDLRELPSDWMHATFSADGWSEAMVKDTPSATYQPRSIPHLSQVAIPVSVYDSGVLAPNKVMVEIERSGPNPYELSLTALDQTELLLETLQIPDTQLPALSLDGVPLTWHSAKERHPDVRVASQLIMSGTHSLSLPAIPADGLTFTVSRQQIDTTNLPFQQGLHAGRRSLLAEPMTLPDAVRISTDDSFDLQFNDLPAYVVLELPRVVHGRVVADVMGPADTVIDIGWDERLSEDNYPLPYPGSFHKQWNQTDSWVLDGTTRSISTIDTRAGRYLLITVWGNGPVHLNNLRVEEERYPVVLQGSFDSPNTRLNQIWQTGVDTLYSNMTDAYTDTPWRERGQWWGDAYVAQQINGVAFGDTTLWRRSLRVMGEGFDGGRPEALAPHGEGNHMLDFGMLWVQSLRHYQRLSGDDQLVRELYPVLTDFLHYLADLENPTTGLLDLPEGHWSQTSLIDWAAPNSRCGQSTALNAMYYGTLLDAAALADHVGDFSDKPLWQKKAEAIKSAMQSHLYDEEEGRYVTTLIEGKALTPTPHAQAWPLAYGVVPESEQERVADALLALLGTDQRATASFRPKVEIYGMFWVLEALGRTGRLGNALQLIEDYYGHLLDQGATTWWENFHADRFYTNSLSHSWGGSPTWFLSTYILGARQTGHNRWQIQPVRSGYSNISGTLPLQAGILSIESNMPTCDQIEMALTSPPDSVGEVIVPLTSSEMKLTLNDTMVWQNGASLADEVSQQADGVHIALGSGAFTVGIDYQLDCQTLYLPLVFKNN
ncbi:MAG: MGH1-like glycoside hydrolase domain-containing protein [Ardenticatenaceae bacterium]